jgi:uncharacterized protein
MAKSKSKTALENDLRAAADRIAALDWPAIESELNAHGCAVIGPLLTHTECAALRAGYGDDAAYRKRVDQQLGLETTFPPQHTAFLRRCHAAGQKQPTPLVLRYRVGDFNCLHQDVYGEHVFPLQLAILLSDSHHDFTGGEFVLTEQRPRMQSRTEVAPLVEGYGVLFPVRERPVIGARGAYRVNIRHGVSRLRSGERFTLGIIFHDAKT